MTPDPTLEELITKFYRGMFVYRYGNWDPLHAELQKLAKMIDARARADEREKIRKGMNHEIPKEAGRN